MGNVLEIQAPTNQEQNKILTPKALSFIQDLVVEFVPNVEELLRRRVEVQKRYDSGERPTFLKETQSIREKVWTVAAYPADLSDRRVEITGPVDRKMIINALNSGANVFMADFEDSNSPTWENVVDGQRHLCDAVRKTISFDDSKTGKKYRLNEKTATLMVRPRGWHLKERHVHWRGKPIPASLFDFGLFFFHNARALLAAKTAPYFYLPKLQSHLEARLWNDVFVFAQKALDLPKGTIRATVLIETLPAAFEMDEILYELRDHSAGLNCGRWDYIFSFIKTFGQHADFVLPDRSQVTMDVPFMRAYTELLVKTCHRRGIHAMGGMAAQIPIKNDPEANRIALERVRADKLREVKSGHDGTWVAHPGLVSIAKEVFDEHMKNPNQIDRKREDVHVSPSDLIAVPKGTRTEEGLRKNIRVGILYVENWLRGSGCVPIYNLMEDAATAEISRTQVWQWIRHHAKLDNGKTVTPTYFKKLVSEEMDVIRKEVGEEEYRRGFFPKSRTLFEEISTSAQPIEFLTLPAYEELEENQKT